MSGCAHAPRHAATRGAPGVAALALVACSASAYVPRAPLTPTPDEPYRRQPPPALDSSAPVHAVAEQIVLANGLRVVIVPRGTLPIAVVRYVSRHTGELYASRDQAALPKLTVTALVGGGTALADGTELRYVHLGGMPITTRVGEDGTHAIGQRAAR
jgi:hypothetical protein